MIGFIGYANLLAGGTVTRSIQFEANDISKERRHAFRDAIRTLHQLADQRRRLIYTASMFATNDSFFGGGVVAPLKVNNALAVGDSNHRAVGHSAHSHNTLTLNGDTTNVLGLVGGSSGDSLIFICSFPRVGSPLNLERLCDSTWIPPRRWCGMRTLGFLVARLVY